MAVTSGEVDSPSKTTVPPVAYRGVDATTPGMPLILWTSWPGSAIRNSPSFGSTTRLPKL